MKKSKVRDENSKTSREDKGQENERKTESKIGSKGRRRERRWNNYKGGQSIRFPQ